MNAIFSFFAAVGNAARAFNRLACAVDAIAGECERRVELASDTPLVIDHARAPQIPSASEPVSNGTPEASRRRRQAARPFGLREGRRDGKARGHDGPGPFSCAVGTVPLSASASVD